MHINSNKNDDQSPVIINKQSVSPVKSVPVRYLEVYKIFNIPNRQLQQHGNNWIKRINKNEKVRTPTRIRLQHFQNEAWQTESVLTNQVLVKITTVII
ncbi:hypothetical protein Glove_117g174 [Diversispora epigaea]|uniref:Uncharacterized protein n=1 Tax=Diversispora epigaea TaxID=1348612 RepID=A0A397JA06_9GLOM|nr:hypothetical protein Glove_117g174 [Diversispora epigaea]